MPHGPAVIGDLMESVLGRHARVLDAAEIAPGFLDLRMDAAAPPGGWQPGHEIQFRVAPTVSRRYSVRTIRAAARPGRHNGGGLGSGGNTEPGRHGTEPGPNRTEPGGLRAVRGGDGAEPSGCSPADHIGLLIATDADGPGTAWMRRVRSGAETTLLAGRHRPLREHGSRRLYLGDGSALGTIDAYARDDSVVVVEVPSDAVAPLAERWPAYRFLPAGPEPGDALQDWLDRNTNELTGIDGAVLLGHAQSIQRQRRALAAVLPRRAITTRPYWATGKVGL